MMASARCSKCGAPLAHGTSGEVCPACLLRLGLEAAAGETVLAAPTAPDGETVLGTPGPEPASRRRAASTPTQIGPYRLVKPIGEGGMGAVYLAEQDEPIRRTVALKLIKLGMDTHEVVSRFEAERQALALMDHPNIASVLDAGETADGRPYFVMEYAPGAPITEYCDAHRLDTRARLGLFIQVCQAIQHAHQKGIIHRDLKPSNVLVVEQDGTPVPKVIDFGIAKATDQRLSERTMFTQHGMLIGTPEYMSPEQADPAGEDIDTRSDIYSLGVVLYELLVGSVPFAPTRLREAGYTELIRIIREEEPPKPSTRLTTEVTATELADRRHTKVPSLTQELRGDLDWITLRALEKDRARRYPSVSEFAADLTRYLNHEPVVARPPSVGYRVTKFVRRNRLAVTAASLVLFAVVAGLVVSSVLYVREGRARREAVAEREQADLARLDASTKAAAEARARSAADAAASAEAEARARADEQSRIALRALSDAQWNLYLNDVDLADREWTAHNIGQANSLLTEAPAQFRNWEWHYLDRLGHIEEQSAPLPGINVPLAMAVSRDGSLLLTANSPELSVTVRDAKTLKEIRTVKAEGAGRITTGMVFSPDASVMAARVLPGGAQPGTRVAVWETTTGRQRCALPQMDVVEALGFTPEGAVITSSGEAGVYGTIQLWSGATCEKVKDLAKAPSVVARFSFDTAGTKLAIVGREYLQVIDPKDGRVLTDVKISDPLSSANRSVHISPDGSVLVERHERYGLRAWSATDGRSLWTLPPTPAVQNVVFGRNGAVAVSLTDRSIRVLDVLTGRERAQILGHAGLVTALTVTGDGAHVISAAADKTIRMWRLATPAPPLDLKAEIATQIRSAAVSADATRLAAHTSDGVVIWDLTTGRVATSIPASPSAVRSELRLASRLWLSPDGSRVVYPEPTAVTTDGKRDLAFIPTLADARSGRVLQTFAPSTAEYTVLDGVALSPRGDRILLTRAKGSFPPGSFTEVWEINRPSSAPVTFKGAGTPVFSPDGRSLAIPVMTFDARGATGIGLDLFDVVTGALRKRWPNVVGPAAFSPDALRLAAADGPATVAIWSAQSGAKLVALSEHSSPIQSLAFNSDGTRIVTLSRDGAVRVFDASSGRQVIILRDTLGAADVRQVTIAGTYSGFGHEDVMFSPDGLKVVAVKYFSEANRQVITIRTWDGTPRR